MGSVALWPDTLTDIYPTHLVDFFRYLEQTTCSIAG